MCTIQIVPRLPPAIDGVGDYACSLAQQMHRDFGNSTRFIVGDPSWNGSRNIDGFLVTRLDHRSADALTILLNQHPSSTILLHYVGYGYANRGCPYWLIKGLENWKHQNKAARLVTMFHEIYASGPIWTSSFWLSQFQRKIAENLVRISDSLVTSRQPYADTLYKLSKGRHTKSPVLPVFSSIGEPDVTSSLADRNRHIVVFGGKAKRLRVYQQSLPALHYACEQLGIEKIIDIGPPVDLDVSRLTLYPLQQMGLQPLEEISKILSNSIAGFLSYNPNFLEKSTIFASYCAHRMLPVNAISIKQPIDSIMPGKHYWFIDSTQPRSVKLPNAQSIADEAHGWYCNHNIKKQAQFFGLALR